MGTLRQSPLIVPPWMDINPKEPSPSKYTEPSPTLNPNLSPRNSPVTVSHQSLGLLVGPPPSRRRILLPLSPTCIKLVSSANQNPDINPGTSPGTSPGTNPRINPGTNPGSPRCETDTPTRHSYSPTPRPLSRFSTGPERRFRRPPTSSGSRSTYNLLEYRDYLSKLHSGKFMPGENIFSSPLYTLEPNPVPDPPDIVEKNTEQLPADRKKKLSKAPLSTRYVRRSRKQARDESMTLCISLPPPVQQPTDHHSLLASSTRVSDWVIRNQRHELVTSNIAHV